MANDNFILFLNYKKCCEEFNFCKEKQKILIIRCRFVETISVRFKYKDGLFGAAMKGPVILVVRRRRIEKSRDYLKRVSFSVGSVIYLGESESGVKTERLLPRLCFYFNNYRNRSKKRARNVFLAKKII